MAKEYSMPTTEEGKRLLRKVLSEKFGMARLSEVAEELGAEIGVSTLSPHDLAGAIIRGTSHRKFSKLIAMVFGEGSVMPRQKRHPDEERLRELCQGTETETDEDSKPDSPAPTHVPNQSPPKETQAASGAVPFSEAKQLDVLIETWQTHMETLALAGNQFITKDNLSEITNTQLKAKAFIHKHAAWLITEWDNLSHKNKDEKLFLIETLIGDVPAAPLRQELSRKLALLNHAKEELTKKVLSPPIISNTDFKHVENPKSTVPQKPKQERTDTADVVIICALHKPELEKVRNAGGKGNNWEKFSGSPSDPHIYYKTTYTAASGRTIKIIASAPNQMGLSASAVLAAKMILRFKPKVVAMVGIAAGADSEKQGYGNILAADTTFDYGAGKIVNNQGTVEFQPDPSPLPIDTQLKTLLKTWEHQDTELENIRKAWPAATPPTVLRMHVGPLGSGASVVDDIQQVVDVKARWRKLIGIEMEAYGVHRACQDTVTPPPKFLCLKSICDFAHQKTDGWQHYAAFTAAEFFYRFLTQEWDSLFPSEEQNVE